MNRGLGVVSSRGRGTLYVVGLFILIAMGAWLVWIGFQLEADTQPTEEGRLPITATPTSMEIALPGGTADAPVATSVQSSPLPTASPHPTAMPVPTLEPTSAPPTETPPGPVIVVGGKGVNIRSGPGTNFTRIGYFDPDSEAPLTGRYAEWWQVLYNDEPAWVYADLVTAKNAESVPQVVPPPSPIPPAPSPTSIPAPTAVPPTQAPSDFRGLVPDGYEVEGAPGPFAINQDIWFNMWITNATSAPVEYDALGTWVEETGQFKKSYFSIPPAYPAMAPGQFSHRDWIRIPVAGTYHLWLAIQFTDGVGYRMMGPIEVIVQ